MSALSPLAGEGARESARWGISFVVICALHLGIAAMILYTPIATPPASEAPPDAVLIDLDPVAPRVAVPTPPPPPPPPEPEVKEEPPPPEKAEVVLPKPPPPKPRPPRRVKVEDPPPQPVPAPVVAPQIPNVAPVPKTQTARAPSVDPVLTWENKLLARMQSFLRYPRRAQLRRQDGISYVKVVIDRRGNVVSSELQRSSGVPVLDEEAVSVVARAKPYPPPPPEIPGEIVVRVVPIRFILR